MNKITPFIGFWVVNSLLIYLANLWLPSNFVLGNARWSPLVAVVLAGLAITIIVVVTTSVKIVLNRVAPALDSMPLTLVYYFFANFAAIWIVARMAEIFGLGISKFTYVAGLALVADVAQWVVWTVLGPKESMSKAAKTADEEPDDDEDEEGD